MGDLRDFSRKMLVLYIHRLCGVCHYIPRVKHIAKHKVYCITGKKSLILSCLFFKYKYTYSDHIFSAQILKLLKNLLYTPDKLVVSHFRTVRKWNIRNYSYLTTSGPDVTTGLSVTYVSFLSPISAFICI